MADSSLPWYRVPAAALRALYQWTLNWAAHPYGLVALALIAFAEASFFPIPPDVLLIALAVAKPRRALIYAGLCTAASLLGGMAGWLMGTWLWQSLGIHPECAQHQGGAWLFEYVPGFHCEQFDRVAQLYRGNAWLALFSAAFTPIPYKVFTIAAGVFHIPLGTLISASALGRGLRFTLVGGLIFFFGASIRRFLDRYLEWLTVIFTILLIGGFVLLRYLL